MRKNWFGDVVKLLMTRRLSEGSHCLSEGSHWISYHKMSAEDGRPFLLHLQCNHVATQVKTNISRNAFIGKPISTLQFKRIGQYRHHSGTRPTASSTAIKSVLEISSSRTEAKKSDNPKLSHYHKSLNTTNSTIDSHQIVLEIPSSHILDLTCSKHPTYCFGLVIPLFTAQHASIRTGLFCFARSWEETYDMVH